MADSHRSLSEAPSRALVTVVDVLCLSLPKNVTLGSAFPVVHSSLPFFLFHLP